MVFYKNLYKIYLDIIQVQPVFSLLLEEKVKVFVMFLSAIWSCWTAILFLSAKLKRIFRKSANIENIPKFSSHRAGIVDIKWSWLRFRLGFAEIRSSDLVHIIVIFKEL